MNSYERTIYFYDPDILKPLIYRLDKGKICTLGLALFNKEPKNPEDKYMLYGCHAVNIVGYKKGEYQTIVSHKSGEGKAN